MLHAEVVLRREGRAPVSGKVPRDGLAFRAMRMFEQQHRLERKLTGGEVAEVLAIPALDGLRPSFWGHCVLATVRRFTHSTAR